MTALPFVDANAVYSVSPTSASEIQARSWSSQIARGYLMAVQASSGMAAIAARMLAFALVDGRAGRADRFTAVTA
ncbi:MAG TPA: hypothetical protein VGD83_21290, partial [Streptosporangiaceae bacterium]